MRSLDTNLQKHAAAIVSGHLSFELQKIIPDDVDYTYLKVLEAELDIKVATLRKAIYNSTPALLTARKMTQIERKFKLNLTSFITFNPLAVRDAFTFLILKEIITQKELCENCKISEEYLQTLLVGETSAPIKVLNDLFEPYVEQLPKNIVAQFSKSCSRLYLLSYRTGLSPQQLAGKDLLNIPNKATYLALLNDTCPKLLASYTDTFLLWESFYFKIIAEYGITFLDLPIETVVLKLKQQYAEYKENLDAINNDNLKILTTNLNED